MGSTANASGNAQQGVPVTTADGVRLSQPATLLWRPDALAHVDVVAEVEDAGVWLPTSYAQAAGATAGGTVDHRRHPGPGRRGLHRPVRRRARRLLVRRRAVLHQRDQCRTPRRRRWCCTTDAATLVDLAVAARGSLLATASVPVDGSTLAAVAGRRARPS